MAALKPAPVPFGDAVKLWDAAMDLPIATPSDFMSPANYDDGLKQLVRVIEDAELRARLIKAGLAEPAEPPKRGRVPRRTVIRLRPSADAGSRVVQQRMSVEEGRRLVTAIMEEEARLRRDYVAQRHARLHDLKAAVATTTEDELPRLLAQIRAVVDETALTRAQLRLLAFHNVAKTAPSELRAFLKLVSPDVDEATATIDEGLERLANITESNALPPMDPRRKAHRDEWDQRLLGVLTGQFEPSREIARRLGAKNATVLERLNDMHRRGLAEKTLRKAATAPTRPGKRKQKHIRMIAAFFRLPSVEG